MASRVPSVEPSSTTISSKSSNVCASTLFTARSTYSRRWNVGTITAAAEPAVDEGLGVRIGVVDVARHPAGPADGHLSVDQPELRSGADADRSRDAFSAWEWVRRDLVARLRHPVRLEHGDAQPFLGT